MNKAFSICYKTFGNPKNPCIILIMGIGGQLIDWPEKLTQGLVDQGFYVVTFDNRDSGLSHHYEELGVPNLAEAIAAKQQGKSFQLSYTLEDLAADVVLLMDELHIAKAHLVGISMGGIIGQYTALNFSDRVSSLTCIASTSGDPALPPAKKEVLEFFSASLSPGDQSLEYFIKKKIELFKIYNHPDYFDEDKVKNQLALSFKRAHYPAGFSRLLLAMISAEPRTEQLKKLALPCLIIHGDYDPVFPLEHGEQLAACIPNSHLEIITKMGHGVLDDLCSQVVNLIAEHINQEDKKRNSNAAK